MRKLLGIIVYTFVQILFIPFGLIGAIMIFYKQMYVSKKLGVSSTAIEIINGRWTMDKFCLRKDPATVKLFNVLPNTTSIGQWLALFPLYLLKIITGEPLIYPTIREAEHASLSNLVTSRTLYIDELINKALKHAKQFVVLGAGMDTRCYGHIADLDVDLYELDKAETQKLKKDYLHQASIDTSNVHFVPIDFNRNTWYQQLSDAGFDKQKVTCFLWEGVSLYLSEEDVRSTLQEIQQNTASGSVVIADFYSTDFVFGDLLPGKKQLKKTNEHLKFGIEFEGDKSKQLELLIGSQDLTLGQIYFMGTKTKIGTWMAVAEIIV